MLKQLSIKNFAIIDSLEIDFNDGFSVITGETGSGKSIILGALQLLMGARADSKSILDASQKCVIEGDFSIVNYKLEKFFKENDLDYDATETIVRREISSNGKSRAFINDSPVRLDLLKQFSTYLIDIHSQYQTIQLKKSNYQLQLVDSMSKATKPDHAKLLLAYQEEYHKLKQFEKELNTLLNEGGNSKTQLDYLAFLHNELEEANLVIGEKEILESQLKLAENQEQISSVLQKVNFVLDTNHSSEPVNTLLFELVQDLQKISNYDLKYAELAERLNSTVIELVDISKESEILLSSSEGGTIDYEKSSDRLNLINQLEQKHRVLSFEDLLEKFNQISRKLTKHNSIDITIEKLENSISELKSNLHKKAQKLSQNRRATQHKIEDFIVSTLNELGIKNGQFQVGLNTSPHLNEFGFDEVRFLFSANKGVELQEMSKVASGGETSRLMLAIKALLAKHLALPCLVLDEIDTGVSGEIAGKIANILTEMSSEIQLIVISHLPQVAAKAKTHYKVEKLDRLERTQTQIRKLSSDERVDELAKMLSGERISSAALENAKALMTNH